jgi:hypothetical protein
MSLRPKLAGSRGLRLRPGRLGAGCHARQGILSKKQIFKTFELLKTTPGKRENWLEDRNYLTSGFYLADRTGFANRIKLRKPEGRNPVSMHPLQRSFSPALPPAAAPLASFRPTPLGLEPLPSTKGCLERGGRGLRCCGGWRSSTPHLGQVTLRAFRADWLGFTVRSSRSNLCQPRVFSIKRSVVANAPVSSKVRSYLSLEIVSALRATLPELGGLIRRGDSLSY